MRSNHALFTRYPIDAHVELDGRSYPSPYHIYDGSIALIGGTVAGAAARQLLAGERLVPILDREDRALAAVWVCDFTEANLGPHHELQVSLFAAFQPLPPVEPHPFAIHRALLRVPETRMVCHGLWNNTETVVRYNSEHLGLNARLARSEVDWGYQHWTFHVNDAEGSPVAEGALAAPGSAAAGAMWEMMRHIGLPGMLQSLRTPFIHVPVVNTRSRFAADNLVADTYTQSDRQAIRRFGATDRLAIHWPPYAALDFVPAFVQQSEGVRFVYLRPHR